MDNRLFCRKGVSLIIVIFAMMLLAVLGWTLAVMQATDFEANLRSLDSEQALEAAEAGTQWAMKELTQLFDCSSISAQTFPHVTGQGEYSATCDDSAGDQVVLVTTGYFPSQAGYRSMRQVRVVADQGVFNNSVTGGDRLDWHFTKEQPGGAQHEVDIDGDLQAPNFEGPDTDSVTNEAEDLAVPGDGSRTIGSTSLPAIDMAYFEDYARNVKGSVYNGNKTFDEKGNYNNDGVYYVKGKATIDLSKGNIVFNHTSIIAENGVEIKGSKSLSMLAYVDTSAHETFPNLASQNGDIISTDTPDGVGDKQKRDNRKFDGLIFTQFGEVDFNYINGVAVMGATATLRGSVVLKYQPKYVDTQGFVSGNISVVRWQEQ